MASLLAQINALTNADISNGDTAEGYVEQWLRDGIKEVVSFMPVDVKYKCGIEGSAFAPTSGQNMNNEISDVDLVILCTPMRQYKKIIEKLNKILKVSCLITDVGSTKQNIIKLKNEILNKKLNWISSHPIAGSEVSGPQYGNKNLFLNKWCVIIKEKKQNLKKINLLNKFWKKIGSKVVFMNPINHDKIFSITSHLPHLIAYNLIKTAQDSQKMMKKNFSGRLRGTFWQKFRILANFEKTLKTELLLQKWS